MAAYNKYNQFVTDLLKAVHNIGGGSPTHTLKAALTNSAPNAARLPVWPYAARSLNSSIPPNGFWNRYDAANLG